MKVREVMNSKIHTIGCEESIAEAAFVMKETGSSCLVVVDGGKAAGVITERDMVLGCLLQSHVSWNCNVYRHMQAQADVISVNADAGDAAILMLDKDLAHLPVVERHKLVGMLSYDQVSPFTRANNIIRLPVA